MLLSTIGQQAANRFETRLAQHDLPPLRRRTPTTLQVNLGKLCDLACRHCHVEAGPRRTEAMDGATARRVLTVLRASPSLTTLDLTGGAPELNPHFRELVEGGVAAGRQVMVRCNLTVLLEAGQEDTAAFFARHRVHVVASLPCYTAENVDRQRGGGTFVRCVEALRRLNALGYGAAEGAEVPDALRLDLVYNPLGPSLPPAQADLEGDYRRHLADEHGLRFDRLLTLANMPIHRFAWDLARGGALEDYEQLLFDRFNPRAVAGVMCHDLLSVDWDGRLADCDFNQMLGLGLSGGPATIFDVEDVGPLAGRPVATGNHCLGCTAGQGSSCGGALADG